MCKQHLEQLLGHGRKPENWRKPQRTDLVRAVSWAQELICVTVSWNMRVYHVPICKCTSCYSSLPWEGHGVWRVGSIFIDFYFFFQWGWKLYSYFAVVVFLFCFYPIFPPNALLTRVDRLQLVQNTAAGFHTSKASQQSILTVCCPFNTVFRQYPFHSLIMHHLVTSLNI